jgi:hypothetical protein
MAHKAQIDFCKRVRGMYPEYFKRKKVVDVGSLDINGNNRQFFKNCEYTGIDIVAGKNVDLVGYAHHLLPSIASTGGYRNSEPSLIGTADVIISTEMLEHDKFYQESLTMMYNCLKDGGLLLITCAGDGRQEHGTSSHSPSDSPGTLDYYKNISNEMFQEVLPPQLFDTYFIRQIDKDLQFFGIKKLKYWK